MASTEGPSRLDCPVCLESMREKYPRALSCLHTFCVKCLERLAEGRSSVTCPTCRRKTNLSTDGISALPVNFFIEMMADQDPLVATDGLESSELKLCQICEGTESKSVPALCICHTCGKKLCGSCKDHHASVAAYKKHKIEVFVKEEKRGLNVNCKKHGEKVTLYCKRCRDFACDICAFEVQHREHGEDLLDSGKVYDEMLGTVVPGIFTLVSDIQTKLFTIQTEVDNLSQIQDRIKTEAMERKKLIDNQAEFMLSEISENHKGQLLLQKKVLGEMVTKLGEMSIVITESYSAPDLSVLAQTEETFQFLQSKFLSSATPTNSGLQFIPSTEGCQLGNLSMQSLPNIRPATTTRKCNASPLQGQQIGHVCSRCTGRIDGIWYRCGMCSDFSLCSECEKRRWKKLVFFDHNKNHVFIKMHEKAQINDTEPILPSDNFFDAKRGSSFFCNRCYVTLPGFFMKIHFRCVMCLDFDLCETCEEKEATEDRIHAEDHVFAKLSPRQSDRLRLFKSDNGQTIPMLELKKAFATNTIKMVR